MAPHVTADKGQPTKRMGRPRAHAKPAEPQLDLYLVKQFLEYKSTKQPATVRQYGIILNVAAKWLPALEGGPQRWEDVKPTHLHAFIKRPRKGGKDIGSKGTMSAERACLRQFFIWAVDSEFLPRNPTNLVPAIDVPRGEPKALDDSVWRRLWLADIPSDDRLWIGMAALSGLRVQSIVQVSPDQVDTRRGVFTNVVVKRGKTITVPYAKCAQTLGRELPMFMPNPDEFIDLVARYKHMRKGMRCLITYDSLTTPKQRAASSLMEDNLPSPRRLNQRLDQILADVGIGGRERFTPHALRHTFVTNMLRSGVPIHIVSELVGHDNVRTTSWYNRSEKQLDEWFERTA